MTRQIAIGDDVYEGLATLRRPGESFTDLLRVMMVEERKRRMMALAGSWKMSDDEAKRIFDPIYAFRKAKARGSER